MSRYADVLAAVIRGDSRKKIAAEMDITVSSVSAIVKRMREEGIDVQFQSRVRTGMAEAKAMWEKHIAESTPAKAPVAPKLTKPQEEARAVTLRALREMYNEPEGTYEELNARLQASAPPTAHEAPEPDGWGDDEAKRVIAELEAPSVPARTSAEVDAKLDALFKEE